MCETVTNVNGRVVWKHLNIADDLKVQGGIDVQINASTISAYGCEGTWNEVEFAIAWVYREFLVVQMSIWSDALMDAFTRAVEYPPTFRYLRNNIPVVEWAHSKVEERLVRLKSMSHITQVIVL